MEYNLSEIDEGERSIVYGTTKNSCLASALRRSLKKFWFFIFSLKEHVNIKVSLATLYWRSTLSWIFSQNEIFGQICSIYHYSRHLYIEIAFCVIMNLKRQGCAAHRRVA